MTKSKFPRLLLIIVLALNFGLFLLKFYVGTVSSAICIYTDAMNNLGDVLTTALALFCGIYADKRIRTPRYPDGMYRLEPLTGFLMAVTIMITGFYFAYVSLERFFYPRPVSYLLRYALLLTLGIGVKLGIGIVCHRYNKTHPSIIVKTIASDSFADCGVSAMTVLSFVLSEYSGLRLDAIFGIAVSIIVIVNAFKIAKSCIFDLLSTQDVELNKNIKNKILASGVKNVRVRTDKINGEIRAYISSSDSIDDELLSNVSQEFGIRIYFNKEKNTNEQEK